VIGFGRGQGRPLTTGLGPANRDELLVDEQMDSFRILSLDGGGIMGAFSASVLATFERVTGHRVVDHFDLLTGTSTGGIIAIGLAMGASAQDICNFYESSGPKIFPPQGGVASWERTVWNLFRPKFSPSALRESLRTVVGEQPLRKAGTRLVIPSYDVNTGKVYLFKTPHHPAYFHHRDLPAIDVALATSAAPTYFPAHVISGRGTFIDGGLWANCPAMVGVVEALDFFGRPADQVRLLSVSTTSYPFRMNQPAKLRGLVGWAPKLVDTFMFGQAQAAVNEARCLLRRGLFHRIDYQVPQEAFRLDKVACVRDLVSMGRQIAELAENIKVVTSAFMNGQRVQPFNSLSNRGPSMSELPFPGSAGTPI
jgi:patatin-like phospholipase/acyl hydrolase